MHCPMYARRLHHASTRFFKSKRRSALFLTLLVLCLLAGTGQSNEAGAADAGCTTPNFAAPAVYGSAGGRAIAVADFDLDGRLDMFGLNSGPTGGLSMFLGDGTGAFPVRSALSQRGRVPNSIAVGDFNGDGRPDLVIANGSSIQGNATVYLNNSSLTFTQTTPLSWSSPGVDSNTTFVAVADFNSDGKPDVVATTSDSNGVSIALGDGTGKFTNLKSFGTGGIAPVHVLAADFNADGKPDLALANSGSGAGNVGILLGDGTGSFGAANAYAATSSPSFIASGDFNSDNKLDLAVVGGEGTQNLAILPGNGAGAFGAPSLISSGGTSPAGIVAADFNGDGKNDLAVTNQTQNTVVILSGDGAGNFNPSFALYSGSNAPGFMTTADLNGDGLLDLFVGHDITRRISVILNACGQATKTPTLNFSQPSYLAFESVPGGVNITVDRNGSLSGTATVNYATSDDTAVSPSDYAATTGTLTFAPGEASKTFTVGIVNDALDEGADSFNVTLSNPTGAATLGTVNTVPVSIVDDDPTPTFSVNDVSAAEGNGGSTNAVFTVTLSAASGQEVRVNYATSDASAKAGVDYSAASGTLVFAPGEISKTVAVPVTGDTTPEVNENFLLTLSAPVNATIADAQGVATIIEDDAACPNPTFNTGTDVDAPSPLALVSGDFNGDGKPDLAAADFEGGSVRVRLGNGAGGFGAATSFPVGQWPRSLALGDFNLDGKTDIAIVRSGASGTSGVSVSLGDGAGGFASPTNVAVTGLLPYFVAVGDFNGDGKPDLVLLNLDPGSLYIRLGDGAGGFYDPAGFATAVNNSPQDAVVGDFNGDGKLDVAVANMDSNNVSVVFGDGLGLFRGMFIYPVGQRPRGIATGDFNGDGKLDLVVANSVSNSVSLLLAKPAGGFADAVNFAVGVRPIGLASADLNGDGWLDVATGNSGDNVAAGDVSVLFGTGAGQFASAVNFPAGRGAGKVVVNDFNGDAKNDLVVANFTGGNLSVLLNGCSGVTPALGTLQFGASTLQQDEGGERATLIVTRTGNTSGAASVDYRTTDTDTFSVGCADTINNQGRAYARCDFATVVGRLDFAPGELQKTITVPLIDDAHDEAAETFQVALLSPIGATLGATSAVTVTILDNDAADAPNPVIASPQFFVRQQYLDFLSREPDAGGFNAWLGVLNNCQNIFTPPNVPSGCDRIFVSGEGFFRSPEFQLKGFYVFRFYKVAFDRLPEYLEVVADMSFVAGQTAEEVYARKAQLAQLFFERGEFQSRWGGRTNENYVSALFSRYSFTQITTPDPASPDGNVKVTLTLTDLVNKLNAGQITRAQVFRALADSDEIAAREFNNAFVGMQYYGYLRRKPDQQGFDNWLRVLQSGDVRTMVNGFLNSTEYKLRFGRP